MASTLSEYYKSQGQALPTVQQRQDVASKAGITGYVGTAEQNNSLLGYLQNTPNQSGNNVITSDNLTKETPIQVKPVVPDSTALGLTGAVKSIYDSTKANEVSLQTEKDKQVKDLALAMKVSGDTSAFDEKVLKEQGVDVSKKVRDNFLTQIEQEQESMLSQVEDIRKNFKGTTAGLNAEINRVQRDSANRQAKLGIGLSSASRDYETSSNIANRLIQSNNNKLKADIESRQFVLSQLGTDLATEKSNSFNLILKSLDKQDKIMESDIDTATGLVKEGIIDSETYSKAISDYSSGKISRSEYFDQIGDPDGGAVNGYLIGDWATDPNYENAVAGNYQSMPAIFNASDADAYIKASAPNSPITGKMIFEASNKYKVDPKMIMAMVQQESTYGTSSVAKKNNNVNGITWSPSLEKNNPGVSKGTARPASEGGNYAKFNTIQDSIDFQAKWLSNRKATPKAPQTLSYEDNARLNSTPQAKAINDGSKFADSLKAYREAIEKYGTGQLMGQGAGTLNATYQAVVGAVKDYYTLGTLDNGVEKLIALGIPKPSVASQFLPFGNSKPVSLSGIDTTLSGVATELLANSEQLSTTKYANSIEGQNLLSKATKLKQELELAKMSKDDFLSSYEKMMGGSKSQVNNKTFFEQL